MNGIIKHVFKPKKIMIDEATKEPNVIEGEPITFYFSLLQQGHQIFEELYGSGMMAVIAKATVDPNKVSPKGNPKKKLENEVMPANYQVMDLVTNSKFITSLAAASYLKILDDGTIVNNLVTANEFLESEAIHGLTQDIEFAQKLMQMITDTLPQETKKTKKANSVTKSKKK